MQPRFIRLRDAPDYLGMDRNRFNEEIRPSLVEIPIGTSGIAFDRLDLDAWADHYKNRNGRPAKRRTLWDENVCQDSLSEVTPGTSTKKSTEDAFQKALAQVNS